MDEPIHSEDYRGHRIEIYPVNDGHAFDPRKYSDNFCTIWCNHPVLGDEHCVSTDPETAFLSQVFEWLDLEDISLPQFLETADRDELNLLINRYRSEAESDLGRALSNAEILQWLMEDVDEVDILAYYDGELTELGIRHVQQYIDDNIIYEPLSFYERNADLRIGDRHLIGYIYVTKEKVIHEYGAWNEETRQKAHQVLMSEYRTYAAWIRGDVFAFTIKRPVRSLWGEILRYETIDECGGFYSEEETLAAAKEVINYNIKQAVA